MRNYNLWETNGEAVVTYNHPLMLTEKDVSLCGPQTSPSNGRKEPPAFLLYLLKNTFILPEQ